MILAVSGGPAQRPPLPDTSTKSSTETSSSGTVVNRSGEKVSSEFVG
ncbi:unnamed protein product, partial [Trichobilharzia regenti]